MQQSEFRAVFIKARRPDVALITNHGYGGVEIPIGGAPDTGGQNMYVNALAKALEALGFRVTVFARGGFPFFQQQRIRQQPEYLSNYIRYIYIPGGGDEFIRKEDIAIALDEQVEWLDDFIRQEAKERDVAPWEVYEFINSHYWDAAIIGERLVERWSNDVVAHELGTVLEGVIEADLMRSLWEDRHQKALGYNPVSTLGAFLLRHQGALRLDAALLEKTVRDFSSDHELKETAIDGICVGLEQRLSEIQDLLAPALHFMVMADALGEALLNEMHTVASGLEEGLDLVDRHVWTPHSLGELKDENFLDRPLTVRRDLKFCERRSHERMICERTSLFAATSEEIAERLNTHYLVPTEQIFYFPPCVDSEVFRVYSPRELEATWAYLEKLSGIDAAVLLSSKVLFETSRMDQTKRKDLIIKAFAQVVDEFPDTYLFIGGGPENEVFENHFQLLSDLPGLSGRAFLTGFIPDEHIGPLFSLASIYVSASEMEGFGMSVSQAAAAKTAVISSDLVPFSMQYVPDEALIVPAGDEEGFADAMKRLLSNGQERQKRAMALAEKVRILDWEVQTTAFLDYLRQKGFDVADGQLA
jgi:glycosyltransferase involved in cell wall biosynthesis